MSRFGQRVVIVAGWVVAAVLAVLVGVVGIGLVGLTDRDGDSMSEADVERALSQVSAAPTPAAVRTSADPGREQSFRTRGGTVVADCDGIVSMSPAQGFAVHEQHGDEGEFRGVRDRHVRVRVQLTCVNGTPHVSERDDD